MKTTIVVAGATGNLGGKIARHLVSRMAPVRALVRASTDMQKVDELVQAGIEVVTINNWDESELSNAMEDVLCVVSALQGLHEVIVEAQSILLRAAVAAGVQKFIPSDYSSDFTGLAEGDNRNFDLRREFHAELDQSSIAATTIFNGAFAEMLNYNIPFLDRKNSRVGYFGSADHKVDFTTMDNIAAFTAEAALDETTPRYLKIAGFQVSANELAEIATKVINKPFKIAGLGSVEDLAEKNKVDRAANPEGENEVFPAWQRSQYLHSMFSTALKPLDNDRYPIVEWTGAEEFLSAKN